MPLYLTPIGSVGSMLERAIAAYLIDSGCGSDEDVLAGFGVTEKKYPCIIVQASDSQNDRQTGNEAFEVQLICKQSATVKAGETNPIAKRVALEQKIGLAHAAMVATDTLGQDIKTAWDAITAAGRALAVSDPDNNADMAEFAVLGMNYSGSSRPAPDAESNSWQEIRHFVVLACARAID